MSDNALEADSLTLEERKVLANESIAETQKALLEWLQDAFADVKPEEISAAIKSVKTIARHMSWVAGFGGVLGQIAKNLEPQSDSGNRE